MISLYDDLTDEQLQALAAERKIGAEQALAERYVRLVRVCARTGYLRGGDSEDLIQEGMLGLLSAIREYDSARGASFRTYAEICVRNRIQTAVRNDARKKHAPLNDGVSLDDVLSNEDRSLADRYFQQSPEEQVLARESESEFIQAYSHSLSAYEARVLGLYLDGLSYREMAEVTGRDVKAVDNAVQRIRRKLAKKLSLGDNSAC